MRHLLLALMIALLPLRAWVGDAMAVSMLGHPGATAVASAVAADAHAPCPDHAVGVPALQDAAHDEAPSHHPHSACDVCNGPALVVAQHTAVSLPQAQALLAQPAERFASAALAPGIKPPIS